MIAEHVAAAIPMMYIKIVTWSLGIFTAISFVLCVIMCVIYGLIVPMSLHMAPFLEMVLPAFKWLTFGGFCLRLIESFLYGIYAGLVFVPIQLSRPPVECAGKAVVIHGAHDAGWLVVGNSIRANGRILA